MNSHFSLSLACALVCAQVAFAGETRRPDTSEYTVGGSVQPLVIYGEGWSQQFTIINVDYYNGGEPTVGTLRFFTRTGAEWRIPLKNFGTVSQVPVSLQPGQMLMVETEVSQQSQQLGWALFEIPDIVTKGGIYHAFTTYRKQTAGAPDLMTSVPFVDDLERQWIIPFDNTAGKYPGIALVNGYFRADTLTLEVFDTAGTLRKTIRKTLASKAMEWFSLIGENPDLAGIAGQIKISSDGLQTAAFTLQFAPNGAFTALPMVHTFGRK